MAIHIHLPHVPVRTPPEVPATVEVSLAAALLVAALAGLAVRAVGDADRVPAPVPQQAPVALR